MTKKLKLPIGILTVLAVFLAALLFLPLGATDGFVVTASAEADAITPTKPTVGDGSSGSPYEISNAAELYWFAALVNGDTTVEGVTAANASAYAKLTTDITVNTGVLNPDGTLNTSGSFTSWTPIGRSTYKYSSTFEGNQYTGTFDGQGYTVSGLYFNEASTYYVSLFGYNKGTIKNVGVVDSYLYGKNYVGGVCGKNEGTIENCYNTGTVSGSESVGGVCGSNNGPINNCYNKGAVSGTKNVGGVCGYNSSKSKDIKNCYNTGAVSGSERVGGVCGYNSKSCYIYYSYNTGTVSCPNNNDVGPVYGGGYSTGIVTCSYLKDCNAEGTTFTNSVGIGKDLSDFRSGEVAYLLNCSQSTETSAWRQNIDNGTKDDYPVLDSTHGIVYPCTPCNGVYSNTNNKSADHIYPDNYEPGFQSCSVCGATVYDSAPLNNGVYEISSASHLYWFAALVNGTLTDGTPQNTAAKAVLMNDITVNNNVLVNGVLNDSESENFRSWTPIGNSSSEYIGTFDGQGHTISGLYFNNSSASSYYVGLFGYIGTGGIVSNVNVVDSYFYCFDYVGGVCGMNNGGTIDNCYNAGTIKASLEYAGGVCGYNYGTIKNCHNTGTVSGGNYEAGTGGSCGGVCGYNNGTITNCYNTGEASGLSNVGGVCGDNKGGTIENCYNTGAVSGKKNNVGGVCGFNSGTIKNCYNTGAASGESNRVGGVCGYNYSGTIANCYNTGTVSGSFYVGGVCGYNEGGAIANCYNTCTVSGKDHVGGVCGDNDGGTIANCYFDRTAYSGDAVGANINGTVSENVLGKITDDFKSGAVAYLLAQGCTINEVTYDGSVWGQDLSVENSYPVPNGKNKVYYGYESCDESKGLGYANKELFSERPAHDFVDNNGFCKVCDVYESATDNDNDGVYEISNAGQLCWFAGLVNGDASVCDYNYETNPEGTKQDTDANAKLTADIIVNNNVLDESGNLLSDTSGFRSWTPIGNAESSVYTGTFDGKNHTVSGLYFNDTEETRYVGLFGYVGNVTDENNNTIPGKVSNVGVVDSYFNGYEYVGGVCGSNGGTIENCYSKSTVSGSQHIGGVCGYNGSTIENCYNTGKVSGSKNSYFVGGVCGDNSGTIKNSYNAGTVSGSSDVGGVCGNNSGEIESCYNTDEVNGVGHVGGVCGNNSGGTIKNCNSTGEVSGEMSVGGVCGSNTGTIKNCYNTGTVSGSSNVCGYNNGAIENCYYLAEAETDSIDGTTFKIAAQFASGEVAYLLNGSTSAGTLAWGQTLTVENKQAYPVLGGAKVYPCTKGCTAKYANTEGATGEHTAPDTYDKDGFGNCKDCDADVYQPATSIDGVYEISNAGQLYWFAEQVNGGNTTINAELTDNITVNSGLLSSLVTDESGEVTNGGTFRSWTPIGNYSNKYGGIFDGNGKTVSGLYFNERYTQYVGLFGYSSGTIRNVGVVDSYIRGGHDSGGVCGYNDGGTIKNCYNTGTVKGNAEVGGVCGSNWYGTIANCYNTGTVSGNTEVGGVRGINFGTIANCYYLAESETDSFDGTTAKSATQFGSGEVAYLLSLGCTINETHYSGEVWGQTIGTDDYPVLDSTKKVYLTTPCPSYTNTENETKAHTDENEDGNCDVCNEKFAYIVSLNTMANEGTPSVANPSGGGKFNAGETTTITAEALPGYTFNGWFKGDEATAYCTDLSFEYTPTADVTFTAKYTANAKMTVTINGGTSYSVSVNGGTASDYSTSTSPSYEVGTKLTVTAKGENFAYWQNEAGSVLSRSAEYTFTVVNGATVTAVYNTPVENKAIVNFISGYDQIINRYQITAADDFTVPAAPTKTGCDFAGWSVNGTVVALTAEDYNAAVKTAVQAAITAALATKEDTTDDIVNVKAEYNNKVQNVTVTVTNGTGGGTYNINTVVTVTANDPESGKKFSHWTDGTNILSYNTSYSFYAAKDITVEAVYVTDTETVTAVGTTEIVDVIKDTTNGKISFVSMSTVPEGCTIVKAGVVATSDSTVGTSGDGFNDTTAAYVRGNSWTGSAYQYSWTKTNASGATWYVRAYLVYTDKNGNTHTMYGKLVTETL